MSVESALLCAREGRQGIVSSVKLKYGQYFYALLRIFPILVSVFGTLLLALILPIDEFGRYSASFALTQIVTTVGLLGHDQLVLRGAISPKTAIARTAVIVGSSALVSVATGAMILERSLLPVVLLVVVSTSMTSWLTVPLLYLQQSGRDSTRAISELLLRSFYQGGVNTASLIVPRALPVAAGGLIGIMVWLGAFAIYWKRKVLLPSEWGSESFITGVKYGMPSVLYSLSLTIPMLYIAAVGTEEANAESRFVLLCYMGIVAFIAAFNNEYFRTRLFAARSLPERTTVWRRMKLTLLVAAVFLAVGVCVAGIVLPALLGPEYQSAGLAILMLAAGVPIQIFGSAFSALLITNRRLRENTLGHAIAVLAALTLSFVLPVAPTSLAIILIANDLVVFIFYGTLRKRWGVNKH